MDILINSSSRLSDLGIVVESWNDTPAAQQSNYDQITNRNTRKRQSRNKVSKEFTVTCSFKVESQSDFDSKISSINALLAGSSSDIRLQRIYDRLSAYQASFLSPSQVRSNRKLSYDKYSSEYFSFMRTYSDTPDSKFLLCTLTNMSVQQQSMGNMGFGTNIYSLELTFETSSYPYWLTTLSDVAISIGQPIPYSGNIQNRMIDTEFSLELYTSASITNPFVSFNSARWDFNGTIAAGSTVIITTDKTLVDSANRTNLATAAKFQLSKNVVPITNMSGTYRIRNGYNLYA